jgi:hypothetical protein
LKFNQYGIITLLFSRLIGEGIVLYGAITIGEVWKFGTLNRSEKKIMKDINSYTIPADVEKVFSILMGLVGSKSLPLSFRVESRLKFFLKEKNFSLETFF